MLSVRNASRRSGRLELVFVGGGGDRQAVLGSRRDREPQPVSVLDPQDLSRPLAAGLPRRIERRWRLAADQAPADWGGLIQGRISSSGGSPVTLAIRGSAADIFFDPASLTIVASQGAG